MLLNKHDLEDGNVSVAGKGTTALGIIGTILGGTALAGGMNNCNGGLLGGLWGNNNGCNATKYDIAQSERISALEATIGSLQADKNTDSKILSLYEYVVKSDKEIASNVTNLFNETFKQIGDLKVAEQVNKMEIDKNFQLVNQKVDYENQLIQCRINALNEYVNATFMPTTKKISLCDICPIPQVATAVQPTPTCTSNGHN